MSDNGSGVAQINSTGQPVVSGTDILDTVQNALTADLATMLSNRICRDGQTTITQNIPFNGKKITGLGVATIRTDAASLATIQDGTGVYVGTVGGTADAIILTANPAITAYVAGQTFRFIAGADNTTNVTVAVSGLVAKAVTKNGATALVAGDIPSGAMVTIIYDGTRFIVGTWSFVSVTPASSDTFTNKSINLSTNTVAGTTAQFNAALSDNDFVTLAGSEVLTNKTLTSPVLNTGVSGSAVASTPATQSGSSASVIVTPAGLKGALGYSKLFTSADQAPSGSSTLYTVAHGLAAVPVTFRAYLRNVTAEFGYAIGDRLDVTTNYSSGTGYAQTSADATNVYYSQNGVLTAVNRTNQTIQLVTVANWKLVLQAWA